MKFRAVLFDFDGVIADTENHHVAAWQRTFGLMGWLVPDLVCSRAAEQDDHEFLAGGATTASNCLVGAITSTYKRPSKTTIIARSATIFWLGMA